MMGYNYCNTINYKILDTYGKCKCKENKKVKTFKMITIYKSPKNSKGVH